MALTHEDFTEIKRVLDERYVQIFNCDNVQQKFNSKFANDDKRIEILIRYQNINNWLTGVIASGIIALLIKVFLGG